MKIPSFKEEIDKVKSENTNKWRWEDGSEAKVKVVGKALALQSYQKSSNNCLLFDLAGSIQVFHSKKRFSNFKKVSKETRTLMW